MSCSDVKTQLGLYLDQELPDSEAERVLHHLKECEACRQRFEELAGMADDIAAAVTPAAPAALWQAIERHLPSQSRAHPSARWRKFLRPRRVAAAILIVVGFGTLALLWPQFGEPRAEASTVRFNLLLDNVSSDPEQALRKFLVMYHGVEIRPDQAAHLTPALNFSLPDPLPGGFRLGPVYSLRLGQSPGIVARYERGEELLVAIFHPPVHGEDFGTHRDYPCIIGKHRGHQVSVGDWHLVHVTDPTTCHCVLSRLDETTELPPVLAALAPNDFPPESASH